MKKEYLIFVFIYAVLFSVRAEDLKKVVAEKPVPLIEEVPAPAIGPTEIPDTKTSKGVRDALQDTKLGLIKEEKKDPLKVCYTTNGKVKCYTKKNNKKI